MRRKSTAQRIWNYKKQIQMGYDAFTFERVRVWFCVPKQVWAARNIAQAEDSQQEELLSDLPLSDIQKVLEQNTDTQDLTFRELVRQLMQDGEYTDKRTLVRQVFDRAFGDVAEGKQLFVTNTAF